MSLIKKASDLRVYRISLQLLDGLYTVAYLVPHFKLRTQTTNSGEAIPPLIAEGFARQRNPSDAARFYELAMVESDEVVVHLEKIKILSNQIRRLKNAHIEELMGEYTALSKQLNSLRQTWRNFAKKRLENKI